MRFLAIAALLAPMLATAAPSMSNNYNLEDPFSNTDLFLAQKSCFLILVRGVLHCHQEVVPDLDHGFPDEEQIAPYIDYRYCLLYGGTGCTPPPLILATRQVQVNVDERKFGELLANFDRTHQALALRLLIDEAHAVNGQQVYAERMDYQMAATEKCCLRNCAFAWWWGPIGVSACMASCTCPGD
ncbi:hypothetical protein VPNG_03946 [Cytospora leucostoma]|uniref:Cyclic nucleotide-binding domain-containing protein n=1 Tax=Cytospora leucostoma TaxID=1230097 RepID=A0A423XDX1_9PEZI|nr:hypothetical protein VPNG_03946 [Cytospora leucostoma]